MNSLEGMPSFAWKAQSCRSAQLCPGSTVLKKCPVLTGKHNLEGVPSFSRKAVLKECPVLPWKHSFDGVPSFAQEHSLEGVPSVAWEAPSRKNAQFCLGSTVLKDQPVLPGKHCLEGGPSFAREARS
ncbi:hypothetical protein SK128_023863 [Halocaridina rubra]|uniref:Uncharacterized protein n=1 Tax=Halocaridina rubra TaxID=373956 RepID=A0AAN9ABK0_HALRR